MKVARIVAACAIALAVNSPACAAVYYWDLVTTSGSLTAEAYARAFAAVTGDINNACPYQMDWDQGDDGETNSDGGLGFNSAEACASAYASVGDNFDNPRTHAKITGHPVTGTPSLVGFLSKICAGDDARLRSDGDESFPTNVGWTKYIAIFDREELSTPVGGEKIYLDYHYCWCGSRTDYHGVNGFVGGFGINGFYFYGGGSYTYPTIYWMDDYTFEEFEEFGDPHLNQIGSFSFQYEYEPPQQETPHRISINLESTAYMLWYNLEQGYDCILTNYDDHIRTRTSLDITTD